MTDVFVFAQIDDGQVNDISLQCALAARDLAAGGKVVCLAVGSGAQQAAGKLFACGADEVHAADHPRLAHYLTTPFRKVTADFLKSRPFRAALFPATTTGNDLAAAVAASLDAACVLDAHQAGATGGSLTIRRLEFDRKVLTAYTAGGKALLVASLKDGVRDTSAADPSRTGTATPVPVELTDADFPARVVNRDVVRKTVNLKDARIIVAAGAGVGSADNFGKVRELAAKLGAEIGATRAVVDAGWLPADHQIGQTGATVRPDLYIACGVSGAVQHWVGMSEAKTIVAINTDKGAPIMKRAHYRIAGDLNAVIPKLLKLLG
jgi:electron transfer flavoprotein alpha subunit